jgi:hypothetical protein
MIKKFYVEAMCHTFLERSTKLDYLCDIRKNLVDIQIITVFYLRSETIVTEERGVHSDIQMCKQEREVEASKFN